MRVAAITNITERGAVKERLSQLMEMEEGRDSSRISPGSTKRKSQSMA
jgi:hypothetical protein